MAPDLESGIPQAPDIGFPALGDWMAQDPDSETFIFRKFERLSARNLLYLQSQVFALQAESDRLDYQLVHANKDVQSEVDLLGSSMKYESLLQKAEDPHSPEAKRLDFENRLNATLKEYYEALLLYSNIVNLASPRSHQLGIFREWFDDSSRVSGRGFPIVTGESSKMLHEEDDLVALRSPLDKDFLTQLLERYWERMPTSTSAGSRALGTTRYYHRRHLTQVVSIITIVTVVLEIVAPVVSLYFVQQSDARLGMICGFTIIFSLSLCYLSNAKRGEIFAAVLVVFVSGELGQVNQVK